MQPVAIEELDDYEPTKGASLTFTFNEGLTIQILPNGDVQQTIIKNFKIQKK